MRSRESALQACVTHARSHPFPGGTACKINWPAVFTSSQRALRASPKGAFFLLLRCCFCFYESRGSTRSFDACVVDSILQERKVWKQAISGSKVSWLFFTAVGIFFSLKNGLFKNKSIIRFIKSKLRLKRRDGVSSDTCKGQGDSWRSTPSGSISRNPLIHGRFVTRAV